MMPQTKLIVVLGITGTQGSSVASQFSKLDGWRVRGITRNINSDSAKARASQGIEIVEGNLNDLSSLKRAFEGANAIFALTDFWSIFAEVAQAKQDVSKPEKPPNELAYDIEVQQGINIAKAASDSGVLATLQRFVFSTLPAVKKRSGGKYAHAYHFDSKAAIEDYIRDHVPDLARVMSTVNMGNFVENWRQFPIFAPQKEGDGYVFQGLKPCGPYTTSPFVVAERDTGVFVDALVRNLPAGTRLLGASELMTRSEYTVLWGKINDKKVSERLLDAGEMFKDMPPILYREMVDTFSFISEFGWWTDEKIPADLGIKTTSMDEFIRGED